MQIGSWYMCGARLQSQQLTLPEPRRSRQALACDTNLGRDRICPIALNEGDHPPPNKFWKLTIGGLWKTFLLVKPLCTSIF